MRIREAAPKWWVLYLMFIATMVVFWWEPHERLSPAGHTVAELAILLAFFTLLAMWLHAESAGLMRETIRDAEASGGCTYRLIVPDQRLEVRWPIPVLDSSDAGSSGTCSQLFNRPVVVAGLGDES